MQRTEHELLELIDDARERYENGEASQAELEELEHEYFLLITSKEEGELP